MSRIIHCVYFPLNIDYWDYYILCGLNIEAARILQRLEFWDGTKGEDSIENTTIQPLEASSIPTSYSRQEQRAKPETPRFIWKSEEELSWELMGSCGEKRLAACLQFLINDRQYVVSRTNPVRRFDRTRQYAVQVQRIQAHLNKLDALIANYQQRKARLPTFIRLHLQKDEAQGFCNSSPLGTTPVSIPQSEGMDTAERRHQREQVAGIDSSSLAEAIPEKTSRTTQTEHTNRATATSSDHLHETTPTAAAPSYSLKNASDAGLSISASFTETHP